MTGTAFAQRFASFEGYAYLAAARLAEVSSSAR